MITTTRQRATPRVFLWPDGKAAGKIDLSPYCTAFSVAKALQSPSGSFQLSINPYQGTKGAGHMGLGTSLERVLRPNAVVSIGMNEPGGLCLGLVDTFDVGRSLGGGSASRSVTIRGQDMGKILSTDHIVHASLAVEDSKLFIQQVSRVTGPHNGLLEALPGVWGPENREGIPIFIAASIPDVLKWLLSTAPSMSVPLLANAGGTGRPGEFIHTDFSVTTWNDARIWSEAPHTFQGSVWDFVRSILDEDFYELFLDSEPSGNPIPRVSLTVRPKPFDEPSLNFLPTKEVPGIGWDSLRTRIGRVRTAGPPDLHWSIGEHEVINEQLGISDADLYSYFLVTAEHELIGNPSAEQEGLFYPAVDLAALQRAGLRSYEARLSLAAANLTEKQLGTLDYDKEVSSEVVEFRNRLVNWYRLNDRFEAGSITVVGNDRYRIGDPVFLPWRTPIRSTEKGARYYCTATTHSWQLGGPYTTQMRLQRGHNRRTITDAKIEFAVAGTSLGNGNLMAQAS